mgnify:CR=1 FL=1
MQENLIITHKSGNPTAFDTDSCGNTLVRPYDPEHEYSFEGGGDAPLKDRVEDPDRSVGELRFEKKHI